MMHQQIKDEIKKAMLAKDALRLSVLRGLLSSFTNELVAQKKKPQEMLPDADAMNVIKRAVKQRKDSIEQFTKGNRPDLVKPEQEELALLETYLPKMMQKEEIMKVAMKKKAEMGATDKSQAGLLMREIMKELKGQADGTDVKVVVDSLFA